MKKILLLSIIILGVFYFSFTKAEQVSSYYISDTFNWYDNETLDTNGDWNGETGNINWEIQNSIKYEGYKSIKCSHYLTGQNCINSINFSSSTPSLVGTQRFYFYFVASSLDNYIYFNAYNTDNDLIISLLLTANNLGENIWHSVDIQWTTDIDYIQSSGGNDYPQWRYDIDAVGRGYNDWSEWYDFSGGLFIENGIQKLEFKSSTPSYGGSVWLYSYIDYLEYADADAEFLNYSTPTPGENEFSFDEFTFQPLKPTDCQYNSVAENASGSLKFDFSGRITNPEDSGLTVLNISARLIDSNNNATTVDLLTTDLEENNMYSYSISSSTIEALELQENTYRLEYVLRIKDNDTGQISDQVEYCNGTGIGSDVTPPDFDDWGLTFSFCTYSDCSSLSWWDSLEKLWCYMSNFGYSIICPEPETLAKAKAILTTIKSKFPYNYILAANTVFNNGLVTTSTSATSTYFQNDWSSLPEVINATTTATGTLGFLDILKLFFTAVLLLLFIIWLIKFSHEIF